ncbi:MAG: D-alanyl-D-alanine carboxypeptidase family protein [Candidatus Eiseniibacteriota bacterium]
MALSPVKAPARSRLGKALAGLVLSVSLLLPGEGWIGGAMGSGPAEASAASGSSVRKNSTGSSTSGSRKSSSGTTKRTSTSTASKSSKGSSGKRISTTRAKTRSKAGVRKKRKRNRGARPTKGVNARAALLIDAQTGEVLFDKNGGMPMPIASLTKLMTAMVFLETEPDLAKRVMVGREDLAAAGKSQLRSGEVVTLRDLLHLSLLSSDNAATRSLVRNSGVESGEFLRRMNRKAQVMGLSNTRFVEFTGLSDQNISSAHEYAQILKSASQQPLIAHVTTLPDYKFRSSRRDHYLVNTNRLCRYGIFDVKGGKTGFISRSGYCLATWVSTRSRDVIAVVFGAPSNSARFAETRKLIDRLAVAPVAPVAPATPATPAAPSVTGGVRRS